MTNPIYDLYEAPASLKEIGLTIVAYLEDHVWKQSNAVAYLAMELGHTNALPYITLGKVTPNFKHLPGWTGCFWIGAYRQFRTAEGHTTTPRELLRPIGIRLDEGNTLKDRVPDYIRRHLKHSEYFPLCETYFGWSYYSAVLLEKDWPSLRIAHTLDPTDRELHNNFDYGTTCVVSYVNNPVDPMYLPNMLPPSRHNRALVASGD